MADVWFPDPGGGENVYEHGGGAVDAGAALRLQRLHARRAVEAGAGHHVGGAVDDAAQRAHHAAEAVVEGDGEADAVRLQSRSHLNVSTIFCGNSHNIFSLFCHGLNLLTILGTILWKFC